MAQKKIKCAVYENADKWGGGHMYIPNGCEGKILSELKGIYKLDKMSIGTYEFEISYLDQAFGRSYLNNEKMLWEEVYWNGTWTE